MSAKSKREKMRRRNRNEGLIAAIVWIVAGVVVLGVIGLLIWRGTRPAMGETIQVMADTSHVPTDSDPGRYNSDPPTSGPHYAAELDAGFYESNDYPFPAGYLVHNLEHGYVIFWYNCDRLPEGDCAGLKSQIEAVMDELGGFKLIAYPWPSLDVPVVMTSWGRLLKFETFDAGQARAFYRANLNKAPEPNAP